MAKSGHGVRGSAYGNLVYWQICISVAITVLILSPCIYMAAREYLRVRDAHAMLDALHAGDSATLMSLQAYDAWTQYIVLDGAKL